MGFGLMMSNLNTAQAGEADAAAAKKRFEEGISALRKDDFQAALAAFEASYALLPKAAVLYNIGMCQKAMFRFVAAKQTLERFMQESDKGARESHTVDAVAALEELGNKIGKIVVRASVEDAEIFLDARLRGSSTEKDPLLVDPGAHVVELVKAGFERYRAEVTVPPGKTMEVDANLVALPKEDPKPLPVPLKPALKPEGEPCASLEKQGRREKAFLVSSVAAFGLAASGIVAGTVYTLRWSDDWDQTDALKDRCDGQGACVDAFNYIAEKTDSDKVGLVVGYSVGGALAIAGATLFVMYRKQRHKKPNVSLGPMGITASF